MNKKNMLIIRKATTNDLDAIMSIYQRARQFMADTGNPNQWGTDKPYRQWIEQDISLGKCYVCIGQPFPQVCDRTTDHIQPASETEIIAAVFYYSMEEDPTYQTIYHGQWLNGNPYGVIHRIASAGTIKGAGEFCLRWATEQCGNLRIDTHKDNHVMQKLLKKLNFEYCGIIHLENGDPRLAYQRKKPFHAE